MKKNLFFIIHLLLFILWNRSVMSMSFIVNGSEETLGNTVPVILIELLFVFTLLFDIKIGIKNKINYFGKSFIVFYIYVIVISIIHSFTIGWGRQIQVLVIIQPLLIFLFAYKSAGVINVPQKMRTIAMLSFIGLVATYFLKFLSVGNLAGDMFGTLNSSYYVLYYLPFCLLWCPKKYHRFLFLITAIVVLSSVKRGGLLALLLGVLAYYFCEIKEAPHSFKTHKIIISCISIFVLLLVFNYINDISGSMITERINELGNDRGSGRDLVWLHVWNMIKNSNIESSLFGHGWETVILNNPIGFSAHNDFLEVIYDFGWVGLILYLYMIGMLINVAIRMLKKKNPNAPSMWFCMTVFIANSMVSHIIIDSQYLSMFALFMGSFASDTYLYKGYYSTNNLKI